MNGAHLHLILTHLPVVGILGVIGILAAGLWRREEVLQRAGLVLMVLVGMTAGAAYLTGEGAEDVLEGRPNVSEAAIEQHEDVALIALVGAGVVAVLGLWTLLKGRRVPLRRGAVALTLGAAVVVSGLMAYAANLGGRIGHPEIGAPQVSEQGAGREDD